MFVFFKTYFDPVEYIEEDLEGDKEKNYCLVIPPLRRRVQVTVHVSLGDSA